MSGIKFRQGGLMRCCISTIATLREPPEPGTIIPCKHCKDTMRVTEDGVIEWNNPPVVPVTVTEDGVDHLYWAPVPDNTPVDPAAKKAILDAIESVFGPKSDPEITVTEEEQDPNWVFRTR